MNGDKEYTKAEAQDAVNKAVAAVEMLASASNIEARVDRLVAVVRSLVLRVAALEAAAEVGAKAYLETQARLSTTAASNVARLDKLEHDEHTV
jgi:hypothetical protein